MADIENKDKCKCKFNVSSVQRRQVAMRISAYEQELMSWMDGLEILNFE